VRSRAAAAPDHLGRDEARLAATLRAICVTFLVTCVATLSISATLLPVAPRPPGLTLLLVSLVLLGGCLWLVQRQQLRAASVALVVLTWALITLGLIGAGGLMTPGSSFYAVAIVAAGLLLGARAAVGVAGVCGVTSLLVAWAHERGVLGEPMIEHTTASVWWIEMVLFASMAGLVYVSVGRIREALHRAERSEQVLAERNRDLERILIEKERAQEAEAELQARMRRAEKLEALGQLASGVAHDFNNLLMVIQGNAQMLEYGIRDEEDRLSVEQIREATRQAAWLTGQLLAFSRKPSLGRRVVDLEALVLEAIAMLERLVPEHVVIETRLEAGRPHVEIDPGQLQQILMILVANARDAMPEGGTIVVSTEIATKPDDAGEQRTRGQGRVVLTVRDEGHGMDAATLEKIFDPYFTTKPSGEGTGLGLASVLAIVDGLGGRIQVDSAPGLGSSFYIELPVDAGAPAADTRSPAGHPVEGERLLGGVPPTPVA
jgi:signal transduction histidine kinase